MNRLYIALLSGILLTSLNSCSTYKSGTTPDDLYYSQGKQPGEIAGTEGTNPDYYSTPNENYVKMRVQNPDKWSYFDDYNYDYYGSSSPYGYGSTSSLSVGFSAGYSPWYGGFGYYSPLSYCNSYYAWNSFYNPYYYGTVVVVTGKNYSTPSYTRMSSFNPSAYQNRYYHSPTFTNHSNSANSNYYNANRNGQTNTNYDSRFNGSRPSFSIPARTSTFSTGGGGGSRGGSFGRPGR